VSNIVSVNEQFKNLASSYNYVERSSYLYFIDTFMVSLSFKKISSD